ncbi:hypothetical protein RFI_15262 [Reticulomyxa filosa]|uniref:Uncharacterized protein n=1 Tax=Reticulomyxa filosa TaxID=46433 RepID=X6N7E9_RETFI|nr:hypothetical protein RFI_15262 [Reticulomyxa filosa]|eukprot:ETO21941.1 hypothetical protein RFI_15262 [Reticulomyxa filosa]
MLQLTKKSKKKNKMHFKHLKIRRNFLNKKFEKILINQYNIEAQILQTKKISDNSTITNKLQYCRNLVLLYQHKLTSCIILEAKRIYTNMFCEFVPISDTKVFLQSESYNNVLKEARTKAKKLLYLYIIQCPKKVIVWLTLSSQVAETNCLVINHALVTDLGDAKALFL